MKATVQSSASKVGLCDLFNIGTSVTWLVSTQTTNYKWRSLPSQGHGRAKLIEQEVNGEGNSRFTIMRQPPNYSPAKPYVISSQSKGFEDVSPSPYSGIDMDRDTPGSSLDDFRQSV